MLINSKDKPSRLQRFLSIINLICVLAFMVALYLNLKGYLSDLYLNLLFSFIADAIVFSYPITKFEESLEYAVVSLIRYMLVFSTVILIAMTVSSICSNTGFTLGLIFTTVDVEYIVFSNLLSVVSGVATLIVSIMLIVNENS